MASRKPFTPVNLNDLRLKIEIKIGKARSNDYFNLLSRFLSSKLNKCKFQSQCIEIIGRENVCHHNHLLRSILQNALHCKVPPAERGRVEGSPNAEIPHTNRKSDLRSQCKDLIQPPRKTRTKISRPRKSQERPSPCGPLEKKTTFESEDPSPKNNGSLSSLIPLSADDGEEVNKFAYPSPKIQESSSNFHPIPPEKMEEINQGCGSQIKHNVESENPFPRIDESSSSRFLLCADDERHINQDPGSSINYTRGPITAPLGIPTYKKGEQVSFDMSAFSSVISTCQNSGDLPNAVSSTKRIENKFEYPSPMIQESSSNFHPLPSKEMEEINQGCGSQIKHNVAFPRIDESSSSRFLLCADDERDINQDPGSSINYTRGPITAPLGIPTYRKGEQVSFDVSAFSSVISTCQNSGDLPNTITLTKRIEPKLKKEGLKISVESANLLNIALDVHLKRLIKPCLDLAASRSVGRISYQTQIQPGLNGMSNRFVRKSSEIASASISDCLTAFELNPVVPGVEWPLQLEKYCLLE